MAFIDETAVIVALPTIQKNLGATAIDAQWVVEAYTLLLAALVLVGGSRWPWSGPSMRRSSRATGSSCSSPAGRRSRAHSALLISGKKPKERDEENAYEEAREDTQEYVLVGLKS